MIRGLVPVTGGDAANPFEPLVRERLVERVRHAAKLRVTLVVAPAGFGKSLAIRQFLDRERPEHVRFTVRREHADVNGFVRGLAEALEPFVLPKHVAGLQRALKGATSPHELSVAAEPALKAFGGTIVIDDLHVAAGSRDVSALLSDLIERRSGGTGWIVATRDGLSLPVASWLAYGLCDMPIDEVDLRLTPDEAKALTQLADVSLRDADVEELLRMTDAWPTAFSFALRAAGRTPDIQRVALGTREMVYGYLGEQVFATLPEGDQEFLLQTALLPNVDLELLAASGRDDAADTMARLRRSTAFITAESDGIFRYSELFKDFLDHELSRRGRAARRRLLLSAADLLEAAGRTAEALALYANAEDWPRAVALLTSHGLVLFERGDLEVLEKTLAALPRASREGRAPLVALQATLYSFRARYEEADALFAAAQRLEPETEFVALVAQRHALSYLRRLEIGNAIAVLDVADIGAIRDEALRARLEGTRAAAVSFAADHSEAARLIQRALATVARLDDEDLRAQTFFFAAVVAFHDARYDEARHFATASLAIAHQYGLHALACRNGTVLCLIALLNYDYAECVEILAQLRRDAERAGDRDMQAQAALHSYTLSTARADDDRIIESAEELDRFPDFAPLRRLEAQAPSHALQATWAGDFMAAYRALRGSAEAQVTFPLKAQRLAATLLYAAACGERLEAEQLFKQFVELLQPMAGKAEYEVPQVVTARILFALACLLLGRASTANNWLRDLEGNVPLYPSTLRAFIKVLRSVYVQVETDAGDGELDADLAELERANMGGYARMIVALPLPGRVGKGHFTTLTRMELRVLKALADGETSRTIGEQFGRSSMTIDAHVKSIIRKLGCRGRREAIAQARSHGLV
ncbi:MAG: hypothetical protein GIW95_02540 [Candidatus Eremiobacteraeota bacterium]|nr:hypothetical protein [Candidatus Eremiobacteraeota bacterium]